MKNRRFPYGYEMINGCIRICKTESEILNQVFNSYIKGNNLKNIAESLTKQRVEYLPDEYGWNKNRIKRIIEDKRYLGDSIYPKLISEEIYIQANIIKTERRTTKGCIIHGDSKPIVSTVHCAECGKPMLHKTDRNKKSGETWYCKNHECKSPVKLTISTIKTEVVKLLNEVICNPLLFENDEHEKLDFSMNIHRLENEINRMLKQLDFDKQLLKNLIFECAAKKYDEDRSTRHITDRLKADFVKSSLLSEFSLELFQRTVSKILLTKNETICIQLKNNAIIGKEFDNDEHTDSCHAEGCQNNTAKT